MVVMVWSAVRNGHRRETGAWHIQTIVSRNTCPSHTGDVLSSMVSSLIPNRFRIQEFRSCKLSELLLKPLKLGPELYRGEQGMLKTKQKQ